MNSNCNAVRNALRFKRLTNGVELSVFHAPDEPVGLVAARQPREVFDCGFNGGAFRGALLSAELLRLFQKRLKELIAAQDVLGECGALRRRLVQRPATNL